MLIFKTDDKGTEVNAELRQIKQHMSPTTEVKHIAFPWKDLHQNTKNLAKKLSMRLIF